MHFPQIGAPQVIGPSVCPQSLVAGCPQLSQTFAVCFGHRPSAQVPDSLHGPTHETSHPHGLVAMPWQMPRAIFPGGGTDP